LVVAHRAREERQNPGRRHGNFAANDWPQTPFDIETTDPVDALAAVVAGRRNAKTAGAKRRLLVLPDWIAQHVTGGIGCHEFLT
jgi:hypothetical protein